jgi:hypothetical protein
VAERQGRGLTPEEYFEELSARYLTARRSAGGIEEMLRIGGTTVSLSFAGDALVPLLFPSLRHLAANGRAPDATIRLWDAASTNVPPPPFPWRDDDLGARGAVAALSDERIRCQFDPGSRVLTMQAPASPDALYVALDATVLPWYERAAPLRTTLQWLLGGGRRHLVHAGAVGAGGRGALIAGPGGSGKSTLAVACLEAGFDYAGDDYVLLVLEDEPIVFSLFGTAKLAPASIALVPSLAPLVGTARDGEKLVVPLYEQRADRLAHSMTITALVLPHVNGGRVARLRPLPPAEALRRFAPSTILQMPHEAAAAMRTMADLVEGVPSFVLELGDELEKASELIGRVLGETG